SPPKKIDPDARIDENHVSERMASRSPSQTSLPRALRICACERSFKSALNPASTASRLVLRPVARSALVMRSSSMTMLVRICVSFHANIHIDHVAHVFNARVYVGETLFLCFSQSGRRDLSSMTFE